MKFWAQCRVPSQFMPLAQPSGVLTRIMLVALANTSECSSGFKIIKLYLSPTYLCGCSWSPGSLPHGESRTHDSYLWLLSL